MSPVESRSRFPAVLPWALAVFAIVACGWLVSRLSTPALLFSNARLEAEETGPILVEERSRGSAEEENDRLTTLLGAERSSRASVEEQLAERERELFAARKSLGKSRRTLSALREKVAGEGDSAKALKAELGAAKKNEEALRRSLSGLRKELESRDEAAALRERRIEVLNEELETVRRQVLEAGQSKEAKDRDALRQRDELLRSLALLDEQIRRALESASEDADAEALAGRVGRIPALWGLLRQLLREEQGAVAAARLAGLMEGVSAEAFADALRGARRRDRAFVAAAADTLARLAGEGLSPKLQRWLVGEEPLRACAIALLLRDAKRHRAVLLSLVERGGDAESLAAARALLAIGITEPLIALVGRGTLGEKKTKALLAAFLELSPSGIARVVGAVLERPELQEVFLASPLATQRREEVLAEILAREGEEAEALLRRAFGPESRERSLRELRSEALVRIGSDALLAQAARVEGQRGRREELRLLLPVGSLRISDSERRLSLRKGALPVHLPFLAASLSDCAWPERLRLAARLWQLGDGRGERVLVEAATHPDSGVRVALMQTLLETPLPMTPVLVTALKDEDRSVAVGALMILARQDVKVPAEEALPLLEWVAGEELGLLMMLLGRSLDAEVLRQGLETALRTGKVGDAGGVARHLVAAQTEGRVELLHSLLLDGRAAVRAEALHALGRETRLAESVRRYEKLVEDPSPRVRAVLAHVISAGQHDLARTLLFRLLSDADPLVRDSAVSALTHYDRKRVLPALRRALRDEDRWVRNAAALGIIGFGYSVELPGWGADRRHPVLGLRTLEICEQRIPEADTLPDADFERRAAEVDQSPR